MNPKSKRASDIVRKRHRMFAILRKSKRASDIARKRIVRKRHRLLAILRMLDNREKVTRRSLAEKFGMSIRTIDRDIKDLGLMNFAITFDDKEGNTYRFVDPDFSLRDLNLSEEELKALLFGKQLASMLGKPFESAFQSLIKKARKETGVKTKAKINNLENKQKFWVDLDPMVGFEVIESQYDAICNAMDEKTVIEIDYMGMHSQRDSRRQIAPYGMAFHKGMWYVVAHCFKNREIRTFALDCIKKIGFTNRRYEIPSSFELDEYLKPGWRMMRYGEPVEVVLRFSKDAARWIKRRKWHPTQEIEEQKDGSLIFKVRLAGTMEIKWWTYNWAPNCEILSPPELRKEAAEEIKKLAGVYGKG